MKKIEDITEMLENGVKEVFNSDRFKEYLDTMAKFYDYSANNCLLIMMQCPQASLVASYKKWHDEFSRQVKKGEKAIKIIAPISHKRTNRKTGEEEVYCTFRAVPVFDLSQTEGKELPSIKVSELKGDVQSYDTMIRKLIGISPVPISFESFEGSAKGFFRPIENEIVVKCGMGQEQTMKTLVHEIAHSILHCKEGEQEDADRVTREVQAESVAYVVCSGLGVDTSDYSFGYIAGWSSGLGIKALTSNLEVIRKTAKAMLEKLGELEDERRSDYLLEGYQI